MKARLGGRQMSLFFSIIFSRRERPLLGGKGLQSFHQRPYFSLLGKNIAGKFQIWILLH